MLPDQAVLTTRKSGFCCYLINSSCLFSFEIVIDDVATTDDLPPTCGMPLTHVIDDVTWVNSVTTGPQEQEFEKVSCDQND